MLLHETTVLKVTKKSFVTSVGLGMLYAELFSVIQNFLIYTRNRIKARLAASLQNPQSFCNQSLVAGWGLHTILQSNTFILLLLFLVSSAGNSYASSLNLMCFPEEADSRGGLLQNALFPQQLLRYILSALESMEQLPLNCTAWISL